MKKLIYIAFFFSHSLIAQELFINNEPASTMPKGLFSYRYSMENYQDENILRQWHAFRIFYGVTPNLTIALTGSISNHHPEKFPENVNAFFANHHSPGYSRNYRLKFDGFHFYAKYRVFSSDQQKKHLRIAVFGEASNTMSAHDEAESHLMGDNAGYGGGFIITKLLNRLALSGTCGFIVPFVYLDKDAKIEFRSGNSVYYNFSAGYLLYPSRYSSYNDLNINLYVELNNKRYEEALLLIDNQYQFTDLLPVLQPGQYSEFRPGVQFVIKSRTRAEVSVALPAYGRTYLRTGSVIFLSYQKYLFKR